MTDKIREIFKIGQTVWIKQVVGGRGISIGECNYLQEQDNIKTDKNLFLTEEEIKKIIVEHHIYTTGVTDIDDFVVVAYKKLSTAIFKAQEEKRK